MPNKAEMQIMKREQMDNSPFAKFSEIFGKHPDPESVALRKSVWGPLTSGQYQGDRNSLSMPDYKQGIRAFLGGSPANPQPQPPAQSLGYPPEVLQFLLQHYEKLFGDYTSTLQR